MLSSLKTWSSIAEISDLGGCDHCRKRTFKNQMRIIQSYGCLKAGISDFHRYFSNRNPFPHEAGCFTAGKELFFSWAQICHVQFTFSALSCISCFSRSLPVSYPGLLSFLCPQSTSWVTQGSGLPICFDSDSEEKYIYFTLQPTTHPHSLNKYFRK